MEQEKIELLRAHDFDVEGTMRRFLNNEALYMKCLKKFLEDASFEQLEFAFEKGDCEQAFKAAHTMKGFVSNIGITPLYQALIKLVEKLRVNDMNVEEEMELVRKLYHETYSFIEQL